MKLKTYEIVFDNPEKAYFAGQEVSGKIVLELEEEKQISEILLELKGRAKTYWSKHSGKSRTHCTQSEPYFCEQFNTKFTHAYDQNRSGKATSERIIPRGKHDIPFSYTLPKNLPSSFEGDFGFVRYTCRAICERPWDFDIATIAPFTVVGIEDINNDTEALAPTSATETNRKVSLCCRRRGLIHTELNLSRTGYTPGEAILVNAIVQNQTPQPLKASFVRLKQHVNYKAKTFAGSEHIKSSSKIIVKLEKGEVAPNSEFKWTKEKLVIPALTPRLSKCVIIKVTYSLEFECDGVIVSLPIIIGSIPRLSDIVGKAIHLQQIIHENSEDNSVQVTITDVTGNTVLETNEDLLSNETMALLQSKKRVRMPSSILSELYPTLPSPYYRESFFGAVDISDEKETVQFGTTKYAPKYPFYTD